MSSVLAQGHAIYSDGEVDVKVVSIGWVLVLTVSVQEINILRNTKTDELSGLYRATDLPIEIILVSLPSLTTELYIDLGKN